MELEICSEPSKSGFVADLGYETYQKILTEAVHELKTDEFAELYADEIKR